MTVTELTAWLYEPAAQVGIIIALAEAAKRLGLENRWIPILDICLGIISGVVVYGSALGLSACGLFSGVKNTIGK